MNDVRSDLIDMPEAVKGQVLPLPDGDYVVLLNARYNVEQRAETYNHEILHLLNDHHSAEHLSIAEVEAAASRKGVLLEEIKRVEREGLPLVNAILKPITPEPPPMPRRATKSELRQVVGRVFEREKEDRLDRAEDARESALSMVMPDIEAALTKYRNNWLRHSPDTEPEELDLIIDRHRKDMMRNFQVEYTRTKGRVPADWMG